jgi:hypothetical protein
VAKINDWDELTEFGARTLFDLAVLLMLRNNANQKDE